MLLVIQIKIDLIGRPSFRIRRPGKPFDREERMTDELFGQRSPFDRIKFALISQDLGLAHNPFLNALIGETGSVASPEAIEDDGRFGSQNLGNVRGKVRGEKLGS